MSKLTAAVRACDAARVEALLVELAWRDGATTEELLRGGYMLSDAALHLEAAELFRLATVREPERAVAWSALGQELQILGRLE